MASNAPLILKLLASSVTAATRAGKIIRDIMVRGELGIIEKGKDDLQTEADRSAQRCIVASLSQQFPHLTIIGEEGPSNCEEVPSDWIVTDSNQEVLRLECPPEYREIDQRDVVVWVDPLDGTSEYTQGLLDHVTVLVGVAVKGRSVGGVIHQPYYNAGDQSSDRETGRTLWGLVGAGVGGFAPVAPSPQTAETGLRVTTTRSHSTALVQRALDALRPSELIRAGGAGYKVLLLIEGKADVYLFASGGCKRWDTCAPEALLKSVGGKLTDCNGREYDYGNKTDGYANVGGVLATRHGIDHDRVLMMIADTVKDALN